MNKRLFRISILAGLMALLHIPTSVDLGMVGLVEAQSLKIPANIDKETFRQLLEGADQRRNADILKLGYFTNHHKQSFPVQDGYEQLMQEKDRAVIGSPRWFSLQSISGWAGIRLGQDNAARGIGDYEIVFDEFIRNHPQGTDDIVWRAVYEYVSTIPTTYLSWQNIDQGVVQRVLAKAVAASLCVSSESRGNVRPPWAQAIKPASPDLTLQSVRLIEPELESNKVKWDETNLKSVIEVLKVLAPDRLVSFLKGKRSVSEDNAANKRGWFLDGLSDALANSGKVKDAVEIQRERIRVTGEGRMRLARLLIELKKDEAGSQNELLRLIDELTQDRVPEQDIVDTGHMFVELSLSGNPLYPKEEFSPIAQKILSDYLVEAGTRNPKQELLARWWLAKIFVDAGKIGEADNALDTKHLDPRGFDNETTRIFNSVSLWRRQLKH